MILDLDHQKKEKVILRSRSCTSLIVSRTNPLFKVSSQIKTALLACFYDLLAL